MDPLIVLLIAIILSITFTFTVIAYLDDISDFYLINVILNSIIFANLSYGYYSTFIIVITLSLMSCYYLKLKFIEVYHKIQFAVIYSTWTHKTLLNAMSEHNYLAQLTHDLNGYFRWIIFFMYYTGTPCIQMLLFYSHHRDTSFHLKIISIIVSIVFCTICISFIILNTWITPAAHKSCSLLYSYLCRNPKIPIHLRLKTNAMIERLSGPSIGFYCYDLFPMNYIEFYQYVCIAGCSYILIMNVLNKIL